MAILQTQDANILDADSVNWRIVVYPVLAVIILILGGLGYYYYHQSERDDQELQARQAILQAKTPEALTQVADRFPGTNQASFALLAAADLSISKRDFAGAAKTYSRVANSTDADPLLRDSAGVGLAATLDMQNKLDDAASAYLTVARRGKKSPYAPYAYVAAARIYEQKKDLESERKILLEASQLGGDSPFTKDASERLMQLSTAAAQKPAGVTAPPVQALPASPAAPAKP